jgi:hypothetical protein
MTVVGRRGRLLNFEVRRGCARLDSGRRVRAGKETSRGGRGLLNLK